MKNGTVRACGIITSIKKKIDKKNKEMAFISIEDFTGKCECVVFSSIYKDCKDLIQPEAMVMVEGNGEISGDVLKLSRRKSFRWNRCVKNMQRGHFCWSMPMK